MCWLHQLFGQDLRVFSLLAGSAEEAQTAMAGLTALLAAPGDEQGRDAAMNVFLEAKDREKRFAREIAQYLRKAPVPLVAPEDIEALSDALYKIPKTAAKFAEHYLIAGPRTRAMDFTGHITLLHQAADLVVLMVRELRHGTNLEQVEARNEQLGQIEAKADKLFLAVLGEIYSGKCDALQVLVVRDLFELLQKVYDRCREAGGVVFQIALRQA
jgi:uncharacterized protein